MTVWISSLLFLLAAASLLAYHALDGSFVSFRRHLRLVELHADLEDRAERAVRKLAEDPTPGADSSHDPVWQFLAAFSRSGIEARLTDISALPGASPFVDLEGEPLFAVERYLLEHRIDASRAAAAVALLAGARRSGFHALAEPLDEAVASLLPELRPVLTCRSAVNVNLAPATAIQSALSRVLAPTESQRALRSILALRRSAEIDQPLLARLVADGAARPALPVGLGVGTSVWRLTLQAERVRLSRTIVRLKPPLPKRYSTIEDRFEPLGFPHTPPLGDESCP